MPRPSCGGTPRKRNVFGVTRPAANCSVPSCVVSSASSKLPPMTSSNTWLCSTVVEKLGDLEGRAAAGLAAARVADLHVGDALDVGVWRRVEQHVLNDAEDRGRAADAQGQRQDGDERESRAPDEAAEAITDVLPHVLQHVTLLDETTVLTLASLIRFALIKVAVRGYSSGHHAYTTQSARWRTAGRCVWIGSSRRHCPRHRGAAAHEGELRRAAGRDRLRRAHLQRPEAPSILGGPHVHAGAGDRRRAEADDAGAWSRSRRRRAGVNVRNGQLVRGRQHPRARQLARGASR